jgi:Kdo2-lipid IVA lauroyltransferase/acyltransferase
MYQPPVFSVSLLHPKYIGIWILVGVIKLCTWMPRMISLSIGKLIGTLFYLRNRKRREIVRINLKLCFPEWSEQDIEAISKKHFQCYGINIIDLGLSWFTRPDSIKKHANFIGFEKLQQLNQNKQPIILLSPHAMGLDFSGIAVSAFMPAVTMMKPTSNPLVNWFICRGRSRFDAPLITRDDGLRPLVREIKAGKVCFFTPDEDFGPELSEFVPFFATQRAMLTVVSRLAKVTKAIVVPYSCVLDYDTGKYTIKVGEALQPFPTDDLLNDTKRVSLALEECISKVPEQYMWTLRWFKTRPNNAPSPYAHLVKDKTVN